MTPLLKENRTALIAGSTGQVGCDLLSLILERSRYSRITVLVRKPSKLYHPLVNEVVIHDFDDLDKHAESMIGDDVFLCLGTSSADLEQFEKVDFDYPKIIAQSAHVNGASQLLFVSALGANPYSKNLYLRTKGKIEQALETIGYSSMHIFRPAIIYGYKDKMRPIQRIARILSRYCVYFLPMSFSKYLSISSSSVAHMMMVASQANRIGTHYYESDQILDVARVDALYAK
jgi:uncharacterized protein YbjT (DUF2867 family)